MDADHVQTYGPFGVGPQGKVQLSWMLVPKPRPHWWQRLAGWVRL